MMMHIRPFRDADTSALVALWQACGLTRPWNDPLKDIARKRAVQPELFLVGEEANESDHGGNAQNGNDGGRIIASAMFGYDGHRGWVYYLAVSPDRQRRGLARQLMTEGQARLTALGCPKLNLQMRTGNAQVLGFYQRLGYVPDDVVSLGKRLIADQ